MENVRLFGLDRSGPAMVYPETGLLHVGNCEMGHLIEGRMFYCGYEFTAMATSEEGFLMLLTGADALILFTTVTPSAAFDLKIYEAPTGWTTDLTLPVVQANRMSSVTAEALGITLRTLSAVTNRGSAMGGGLGYEGGNKTPGTAENPAPYLLKPGTRYLLVAKNTNGENASIFIGIRLLRLHENQERPTDA